MTFTPGPWRFVPNADVWAGGYKVVEEAGGPNYEQAKANANLIAAAPEMLEALKDIRLNNAGTAERLRGWNNALAIIERIEGPQ